MESIFLKEAFLGAMSREIRTTLTTVTGYHHQLLETALAPEQRRLAEQAHLSTETLLSLVNDLTDYSRMHAGGFKLDIMEFDLRTAIEDAVDDAAQRAYGMGCEIHLLIHASVPETVQGDPARLRRVVVNLANAALDNACSAEMVLSVRTVEEHGSRVAVRFEITGFGIGLAPGKLQQLFLPFTSPESVAEWQFGRTGLDLAFSKQLVRMMGGQIGFSDGSGNGATFWFTVELTRCGTAISGKNAPAVSVEGMKVIVADPSPPGRAVVVHYLESMGIQCREFGYPEEVLRELSYDKNGSASWDACIIALQQVGETGSEIAGRLRNSDAVKSIPIVLITAIGNRGDALKMKDLGIAAYLTRPVRHYQLAECMRMIRKAGDRPVAPHDRRLITRHTIAEAKTVNRIRILLADDNAVNRRTIRTFLDRAGYACEVAENGADALNSLSRKPYDFIFLDCRMPVMDGFAAAQALRQTESAAGASKRIPVCGLAATDAAEERQRCMEAGMDDCLVKPFGKAECIAMVEKWIPSHR
jgi:CheY-like chemotaxis protein